MSGAAGGFYHGVQNDLLDDLRELGLGFALGFGFGLGLGLGLAATRHG